MIEIKNVFPECDVDTLLVELILQRGKPMHNKGITKVVNSIANYNNSSKYLIGITDTDRFKRDKDNPNLKKFSEIVADKIEAEGLLIIKIPATNKYLIRINPDFEPWLWKLALECNINPSSSEYGFSSYDEFYKASKRYGLKQEPRLKKFVNAVVLNNPPAIVTLKIWLEKSN